MRLTRLHALRHLPDFARRSARGQRSHLIGGRANGRASPGGPDQARPYPPPHRRKVSPPIAPRLPAHTAQQARKLNPQQGNRRRAHRHHLHGAPTTRRWPPWRTTRPTMFIPRAHGPPPPGRTENEWPRPPRAASGRLECSLPAFGNERMYCRLFKPRGGSRIRTVATPLRPAGPRSPTSARYAAAERAPHSYPVSQARRPRHTTHQCPTALPQRTGPHGRHGHVRKRHTLDATHQHPRRARHARINTNTKRCHSLRRAGQAKLTTQVESRAAAPCLGPRPELAPGPWL
jgi:hypothetical protein